MVDRPRSDSTATVRALERGLDLLREFNVADQYLTLAELSRRTGLHRATTRRLLKTLEHKGFVIWDADRQVYSLGPALLRSLYALDSGSAVAALLKTELEALWLQTAETVGLAVFDGADVRIVSSRLTPNPFKPAMPAGAYYSLDETWNVNVKIFLASLGRERRQQVLAGPIPRLTPRTVVDPVALALQLEQEAQQGFAYDFEEGAMGRCAVAVPVRDGSGRIIASLSVVAPTERFGPEETDRYRSHLLDAAETMAAKIAADGVGQRTCWES